VAQPVNLKQSTSNMSTGVFPAILAVVRRIPRGRVATYGEVAAAAGFPGAARQVVWALRAGQAVPWHRVLGAGGRIRLKGEAGLEQCLRLRTEGVVITRDRIDLEQFGHRFSLKR
jgi:methylated-DNA-protein-cysteine methyltransferase related protein